MSKSEVIEYTCPKCERRTRFQVWKSINTDLNPELRMQLLDGNLLKFKCINCGCEQEVAYALLFHDPSQKYMVWWLPTLEEGDPLKMDPAIQMMEMSLHNYRLRVVNTYNKLSEKIRIFDNGLDDRLIEMLKEAFWNIRMRQEGVAIEWFFFNSTFNDGIHEGIEFVVIPPGKESYSVRFDGWDDYKEVSTILFDEWGVSKTEITKWRVVDKNYSKLAMAGKG